MLQKLIFRKIYRFCKRPWCHWVRVGKVAVDGRAEGAEGCLIARSAQALSRYTASRLHALPPNTSLANFPLEAQCSFCQKFKEQASNCFQLFQKLLKNTQVSGLKPSSQELRVSRFCVCRRVFRRWSVNEGRVKVWADGV